MGKAEAGTPKAIANQMKAKGLQKLRWYCQMCQKQCRDENGFQCHLRSESHQRNMEKFGENPRKHIEEFSEQFERDFLEHIASTHRNKPIHANQAYNEFIRNRHHIHMNATKWTTLTEFVQDLGKRGIAKIEETPRGLYITYKPKDYQEELREKLQKRKQKEEEAEEQRQEKQLRAQIQEAKQAAGNRAEASQATELKKGDDATIALSLGPSRSSKRQKVGTVSGSNDNNEQRTSGANSEKPTQPSTSDEGWLKEGIVVKVLAKQLQGYYKKKGSVERVIGGRVAELRTLESGDLLRVDQGQLETVIPKPGGNVLVVRGEHEGETATLESVDTDNYKAHARLLTGASIGSLVPFEYEDISKLPTR